MNAYEPNETDLTDYIACCEARDREEQQKQNEDEISVGDKVTMKVRIPGFHDDEVCRVDRITTDLKSVVRFEKELLNNVFVDSLDGERCGWTSLSNLSLYHG